MSDADPDDEAETAAWRFVNDVYAHPGVSPACLTLQDEAGIDVVALLVVLWAAVERGVVDPSLTSQVDATSRGWSTGVVKAIRSARREIEWRDGQAAALRPHALGLELDVERYQVAQLADLTSTLEGSGPGTAHEAAGLFAQHVRAWRPVLLADPAARRHLATIVGAAVSRPPEAIELLPASWDRDRRPRPVRVSMVQVESPTDETVEARIARVVGLVEDEVAESQPDLVVLPELWATGCFHFDRYEDDAQPIEGPLVTALGQLAARTGTWLVGGSFVESHGGLRSNTTVCFDAAGVLAATYRKIHLFGFESEEARLLTPGTETCVLDAPFGRIGLSTCYDLRFPELYRRLVDDGAEMVVAVSAWPESRREHWQLLNRSRAVENLLPVVACNAAGRQGKALLAGRSIVVGPWGDVVAEGRRDPGVVRALLDLAHTQVVRRSFPALTDRRLG